jgi:hypothetical protein
VTPAEEYEGAVERLLADFTRGSLDLKNLPRRGRDVEWLTIHSHAADVVIRLKAELAYLRAHKEVTNDRAK